MPAIHLPRLRKQVTDLIQHYADPDRFLRELSDMFAFYGDHTKRVSPRTPKTSGLPTANVPQPVLRQIVQQLTPYAENVPHAILVLARSLWNYPHLEHRQLATMLLGKLPLTYSKEILPLVPNWCRQNYEETLLLGLANNSLEKIQKETPEVLLEHIESWLYPEPQSPEETQENLPKANPAAELNLQKLALTALVPLVRTPDFLNLPRVYKLLKPLLRDAPTVLRPYLVDVLRPLARRSPQEITYILRTEMAQSPSKHLTWLARRTLDHLPPEHAANLRRVVFPKTLEE